MKVYVKLPMTYQEWEKVGLPIEGKSLMSSLTLIETEILDLVENGPVNLSTVIEKIQWPDPIVLMAVGGMVRERLIVARRQDHKIVLSLSKQGKTALNPPRGIS